MEHYKLVIGNGNVEISSHDKEWVEKKEKEYIDKLGSVTIKKGEINPTSGTSKLEGNNVAPSSMPINEFYRKFVHSKIKSRPDITTFFVYYLTKIQKNNEISPLDIKNLYKQVQYPNWNKLNIADMLNKAKKKALLNSISGQWSLTITGEDFVLNNMSDNNA